MNLQWKYNNVWIKEGDKWKAAFTIPEGLFELAIIFFRLTNSSITFQTMINKILWNLINTGKMVSFINDVIIGIEREKGHDKLVEENGKKVSGEWLVYKTREVQVEG